MRRPAKPARYEVIPLPEAVADILALAEHGAGVVAAAPPLVED